MVEHALIPIGVCALYSGEEVTVKTIMVRIKCAYLCLRSVHLLLYEVVGNYKSF